MLAWPHVALLDLDAGGHLRLRARGHRHRDREACLDCGAMFASIVVGTDGSQTAREAVRQAVELAHRLGARLDIVSAYEPVPAGRLREEAQQVPGDLQWMVNAREDVDATLREAAAESEAAGVATETYARQGDPADAILDVAEERGADLIVVGNKGMTGAKRFLLGSVPNKVSHHAPCSVLIIRTS
jgi:nucleotide-binding universal stress UspA family protein